MKKFNWQNIRLVLMLIVVIFLYSFTQNRSQNKKISKIQVEFQGNNKMFLTNEMVNNLLIQNLGGTSSIQKDKVDLKELESALKKQSFIENAEVYISEDGMLTTKVLQKSPIASFVC
jgi:cell division protein FtsQ